MLWCKQFNFITGLCRMVFTLRETTLKILTLYLLLCRYKNNDLNGWYTHLNSKEGKMNNLTAKVWTFLL